eukprot:TRINITY_DN2285_c0_g1_i1.p1 TRINITY_DN2285_c0_g1~~TRINITY_DN2285_c0_g1_i1.p1  ORF type:complete len:269 (-),score=34.46 TRINITY_DN2285_c0_g1_i1:531-1337(-)
MIFIREQGRISSCIQCFKPIINRTPILDQVRLKHIRPKRATWFRQKLLAVSKPAWDTTDHLEDIWKNCQHAEKQKEQVEHDHHINQLEKFYVKEMVEEFENSKMIGFFHNNPMKKLKTHAAWQNARRAGMEMKLYHHRIGLAGLTGTQWENCLHFWFKFRGEMNRQVVVFSPTVSPEKLLKYEKKVPEFFLLGAVVDNRILSRKQLQEMTKMPSLDQSRGELVGILGYHQQRTLQLLQANQQQLSTNLTQLVKDRSEPAATGDAQDSS